MFETSSINYSIFIQYQVLPAYFFIINLFLAGFLYLFFLLTWYGNGVLFRIFIYLDLWLLSWYLRIWCLIECNFFFMYWIILYYFFFLRSYFYYMLFWYASYILCYLFYFMFIYYILSLFYFIIWFFIFFLLCLFMLRDFCLPTCMRQMLIKRILFCFLVKLQIIFIYNFISFYFFLFNNFIILLMFIIYYLLFIILLLFLYFIFGRQTLRDIPYIIQSLIHIYIH